MRMLQRSHQILNGTSAISTTLVAAFMDVPPGFFCLWLFLEAGNSRRAVVRLVTAVDLRAGQHQFCERDEFLIAFTAVLRKQNRRITLPAMDAQIPGGFSFGPTGNTHQSPQYLAALGRASLTVRARPPTSLPLNWAIALAASSSDISANPNPFILPVSRSLTKSTESTGPTWPNSVLISSSVVLNDRLPI